MAGGPGEARAWGGVLMAPLPEDRLDAFLVWLGLLLVGLGFWLLVIAGARWLLC